MSAPTDREPSANGCERCGRMECPALDLSEQASPYRASPGDGCSGVALNWRALYFARAREGAASEAGASAWRKEAPTEPGLYWYRPSPTVTALLKLRFDGRFMAVTDGHFIGAETRAADLTGEWSPCLPPAPPPASAREVVMHVDWYEDEAADAMTPLDGGEGNRG